MTATEDIQQSWKKLKGQLSKSYQKLRVQIQKLKNKRKCDNNYNHSGGVSIIEESETLVEED